MGQLSKALSVSCWNMRRVSIKWMANVVHEIRIIGGQRDVAQSYLGLQRHRMYTKVWCG